MEILPIKAFTDNYIWMIVFPDSKKALVVDPGDATPVIASLNKLNLDLIAILVTHNHYDHVSGITELCKKFSGIPVYGPHAYNAKEITNVVNNDDIIEIHNTEFKVIATPGHTLNHVVYYSSSNTKSPILFCGDTLFSCGCGRLFEGTAKDMLSSLKKIMALPKATLLYPAHEYTLANIKFAMAIEPNNQWLQQHFFETKNLRANDLSSLPVTLENELRVNPFLRYDKQQVYKFVAKHNVDIKNQCAVFSFIRKFKDNF